jgi:excisionase family DNA binding protein
MKEIMTKHEVAALLNVSPRQVQRLIAERKLRASRLSHKVLRIKRSDLERYIDRNSNGAI